MVEISRKEVVNRVLAGSFEDDEAMRFGSSSSGHGVRFGKYAPEDGELIEVAAKPYLGKKAVAKANYEFNITRVIQSFGFNTLRPIDVKIAKINGAENPAAVLLKEYVRGQAGGNTLPLDAEPTSEVGKQIATAVGRVAAVSAHLHSMSVTHGDPQMKNFGFDTAAPINVETNTPLIFDFEKATLHAPKTANRRSGFVCSNLDNLYGAIGRDLERISYSLGSRLYGNGSAGHFYETVIEPYMSEISPGLKDALPFIRLVDNVMVNFLRSQEPEHLVIPIGANGEATRA